MLTFPKRDHSLRLQIFPEVDLLMTLPRMDELYINDYITEVSASHLMLTLSITLSKIDTFQTGDIIFPWRINSDLFFNLLGKTKKLILSNVILSVEDCEKAVKVKGLFLKYQNESIFQIVSTAFDSKMVRVQLINSVITSWLHTYNVYQSSKEGQGYGEVRTTIGISIPYYNQIIIY